MSTPSQAPVGESRGLEPPKVSGGVGVTGHLEDLRNDPVELMWRVRNECGDVGEFRLADQDVVLLSGADANEAFFRASEEELDQAAAYPFMTPVFGEGIVFDASAERRREMLHNQSLRDKFMRGHAEVITAEVDRMVAGFGDNGEIDLLDWTAELFIYTSSACLIGKRFREELDVRYAELFHDLERGTDAVAFVDPYADIESFHRRDAARVELVGLIEAIMHRRDADGPPPADERDLVDVLMSLRNDDHSWVFSPDQVTGMFISMMFAGHHTTSTTASWAIIELLRNPDVYARVTDELDALAARSGGNISYHDLREVPWLEATIKETLRLHPRSSCCCARPWWTSRWAGFTSPPASWWVPARRCPTSCPGCSTPPTSSGPSATSIPTPTTSTTRGTGFRSELVGTAAWGRRSP